MVQEQNNAEHGLVYPVKISNSEVERCLGRMNIDILVKNGVPWAVEQVVDILIDKIKVLQIVVLLKVLLPMQHFRKELSQLR